ncbi:MAG TPA: mobile mystery protein B [Chitinophagaceae bacterium]|nr:mobile mystery protein B [Chitinophagaceae bacterium]
MGLDFDSKNGQTPLDDDEKEGLLIKSITNRGELDEFEQHNIEKALLWLRRKKISAEEILSEKFVRELHLRMYDAVWKWAGTFRQTNKNIGIEKHNISTALKQLLDDCRYWILNQSYPPEEIIIQFKHRLVYIHCFSNGNGRHSRLIADVMMEKIFQRPPFTWGAASLSGRGELRTFYINALKKADAGDYKDLLAFAKS